MYGALTVHRQYCLFLKMSAFQWIGCESSLYNHSSQCGLLTVLANLTKLTSLLLIQKLIAVTIMGIMDYQEV